MKLHCDLWRCNHFLWHWQSNRKLPTYHRSKLLLPFREDGTTLMKTMLCFHDAPGLLWQCVFTFVRSGSATWPIFRLDIHTCCRCQLPFHCCLWLWFQAGSFKDEVTWVRLPGKDRKGVSEKKLVCIDPIEIRNTLLKVAQAHAGHGHMSSLPRLRPWKGGPTPVQQCGLGDTPGSSYTERVHIEIPFIGFARYIIYIVYIYIQ